MRRLKEYEILLIQVLSVDTDFNVTNNLDSILVEEPFSDLPTIRSDKTPLGVAVYGISHGHYLDIDGIEIALALFVDKDGIFGELDYWKVNDEQILSFPKKKEDIYRHDDQPISGQCADGYASYLTFGVGRILGNPDLYGWRDAAGNTLIKGGFSNFNNLYNGQYESAAQWEINQLKKEQKSLQSVYEKYLKQYGTFRRVGGALSGGVELINYKSRVNFGCKKMGYSASQRCRP